MTQEALSGIDFELSGVVRTENEVYSILIDETSSMYLPVACGDAHASLVNAIMTEEVPFDINSIGIYFTLSSLMKASGISATELAIIVGKGGALTSYLDAVQENELGIKVSRIPVVLPDAMVLCALFGVPVVVYGSVSKDFAFAIDKNIPKENVMSFIYDDINKAEKLMAMHQEE